MKISRFFGLNSRDVMRQVRQVLGPDALIVSNRSVDGGIEVLATVDGAFDEAAGQAQQPPQQHASQQAPQPATHHAPYQEQTPAVMPPTAYPAPSRPIAAYQSAYAASALPEDEDEAGMMPASAPAAPVRVEIPPLPSAAPVRMEMPPLAPAAPVRMEMPPLQAAPQARAPAMPAVPPVAPQGYARPPAPQQQPMPQQHAAPQPPATPPAYRAAPQAYAQPAAQPAARPPVAPAAPAAPMHAAQPAPQPPAAPMPQAPRPPAAPMARMPDAPMPQGLALPPGTLPADTAAGLQNAISALRGALESRMDGLLWGGRQGPGREPAGAALFRSLLDAGFSTKLVRTLVERMPEGLDADAALAWARNELVTHLPVLGSEDTFLSGGVYALVGPTGVGKTTTLAKLAARCVAREGRDQVAMLTTDNFRIGALEQLQIYGRLMGVPTHSVRDAGELRRLLAELGSRKIVLIDTTGISQRDRHVAEQAAMLCDAGKTVRRLLVLNAASQGDTLDEVAHAYRNGVGEDVAGCIITKLDEASRLGAALDTAIRHRLPIHYMSVGQKVPEHLELARPDALIDRAFAMVERARALYTPSEADLASLWSSAKETPAVDPARRRQLLASAILRPQGGAAAVEAAQNLDDTLNWLDSDLACARARASWREYVSDGAGSSLSALADEPLAMARREFSAVCGRHLLVMHGKVGMKGDNLPGGTLLGSMLMSDRGAALAAPAQQLALAHGMLSSFAPGAAAQPDPAAALEARVRWLGGQLGQVPLVHMLEAGTSALWSALTEQGVSWVARSPGGLRVIQDECPTNLNAVGKSVGYLPVGQPGDMPGLRPVAGGRAAPLALWASGTEIGLPGRAGESAMRLVCARLIDTVSGEVVAQFFGLTNLPASQADAGTVARWLVLQDEAKAGFRYMANAWQALPAVDGAHALARQALMAGQLAAACWQLAHSPAAEVVRGPLSGVAGVDRVKLTGRMLPVALLKMYAMLEMADGG
ncbi:flagellar biosynthesis protein FlhF [Achromobacter sp. AONIH1]|uniref:flagellar biosynthesis protein FlhF n=1 Tax=Achromobacter sp. AONIH1 TaxID=1758194 RepID=UPI000CD1E92F|nr:flagellar biosynthesis protein FlhF [Achromobacter sp. AONIH1]AUT47720.1 flagellar biosynthesis protein FlhF [Achromobacter sp. AONIH1]